MGKFAQKLLGRGKEKLKFNHFSDPIESSDVISRIVTTREVLKNSLFTNTLSFHVFGSYYMLMLNNVERLCQKVMRKELKSNGTIGKC